jgi:hypothetical protein
MALKIVPITQKQLKAKLKTEEMLLADAAHEWIVSIAKGRVFKDYAEIMNALPRARKFLMQKGIGGEHELRITLTPGEHDHIEVSLGEKPGRRKYTVIADVVEAEKKG